MVSAETCRSAENTWPSSVGLSPKLDICIALSKVLGKLWKRRRKNEEPEDRQQGHQILSSGYDYYPATAIMDTERLWGPAHKRKDMELLRWFSGWRHGPTSPTTWVPSQDLHSGSKDRTLQSCPPSTTSMPWHAHAPSRHNQPNKNQQINQ